MTTQLEEILNGIKKSTLLWLTALLVHSCTTAQERTNQNQAYNSATNPDTLLTLTPKQETAFDALNSLQRASRGHLYSTFEAIGHSCFPPDTNFVISRAELLIAMEILVTDYCTSLTIEERNVLTKSAVLAQEEYLVLHCYNTGYETYFEKLNQSKTSRRGMWVMPSVLGRRDVVFKW